MKDTLCWKCQRACRGCSWSRSFKPIEGWEAIPTEVANRYGDVTVMTPSYHVISCPLFVKEKHAREYLKPKEINEVLGLPPKTLEYSKISEKRNRIITKVLRDRGLRLVAEKTGPKGCGLKFYLEKRPPTSTFKK